MHNIYKINERPYNFLRSIDEKLDKDKNYLFDLDYLGIIEMEGDKAEDFLQGQLSGDLKEVNQTKMQQGLLANLKGRVITLLDIIKNNGLQLILPKDLIDIFKHDIEKAARFSRVNFNILPFSTYKIFGLYIQNPKDNIPFINYNNLPKDLLDLVQINNGYCYKINDKQYILKMENTHHEEIDKLSFNLAGSLNWHKLQLKNKIIEIYPSTSGLFLPHKSGLHLQGYLNFNKGCYKGQEIIARTHFRAKLKHNLKIINYKSEDDILAGDTLIYKQKKCDIIDYCPINTSGEFLVAITALIDN